MVKIVYIHTRRARIFDLSYDDVNKKHCVGDKYIIPKDARMAGIEDV